jgi:hypothetical protein
MKRVTIVAVLLLIPNVGQAQNWTQLAGAGMMTCSNFAEAYRQSPDVAEMFYFSWAQGFMSGMNSVYLSRLGAGYDLSTHTATDQQAYIRDYCNQHPLATYGEAATALFGTMTPRRR